MLTLPMMTAGVALHTGEQLRASPGRNSRSYRVIVPSCYIAWVIIYVLITIAVNATIIWLTVYDNDYTIFDNAYSWCFVGPRQVYDTDYDFIDNPCIDVDKYWDTSLPDSSMYYEGQECTWNRDYPGDDNFCSTTYKPYSWCQEIYDTIVDTTPGNCGGLTINYLVQSNFSIYADDYFNDWEDDGDYDFTWTWVYPAILDFWLIFIIAGAFSHPKSIQRVGDSFEIRSSCGTRIVPLSTVSQVMTFDYFNWCAHRYVLRGLRYLTFSFWRGTYANNQPLVVLITQTCSFPSYRLSMPQDDYAAFVADNIAPAALPAVATTYGAVAVRTQVPVGSPGVPTATVAVVEAGKGIV